MSLQIIIYGQAGVGKTTFAKYARDPFFIDLENGTVGVPKDKKKSFPIIGFNEASKNSVTELHKFLDEKLDPKGELEFKTLVIDSLTRIDEYMEKAVIEQQKALGNKEIQTLADFAYGAGYALVKEKVMNIVNKCIALSIQKDVDLVLIAHSKDKQVKRRGQEPYDMVQPRISKGAMSSIIELVPYCFYLGKDVVKDKKGISTNLYTVGDTFCEQVKSRVPLYAEIYNMTGKGEKVIEEKTKTFWNELYGIWDKVAI